MNLKEMTLPELELHDSLVEEGLRCLLHTILFVRSPGSVRPQDSHCALLAPLTYAKCGVPDVDTTVNNAIIAFQRSLISVSPTNFRGTIVISFFETRPTKSFLGWMKNTEKVYFE